MNDTDDVGQLPAGALIPRDLTDAEICSQLAEIERLAMASVALMVRFVESVDRGRKRVADAEMALADAVGDAMQVVGPEWQPVLADLLAQIDGHTVPADQEPF